MHLGELIPNIMRFAKMSMVDFRIYLFSSKGGFAMLCTTYSKYYYYIRERVFYIHLSIYICKRLNSRQHT